MDVIILAAGRGTRMQPLSDAAPKPMLPLAGTPIAARVADAAIDAGATKLVFVVGYQAEAVESYFGSSYRNRPVEYAVQEQRSGTADAVGAAIGHIDGAFAVLNGDNVYTSADLAALFESVPAVGVTPVEDPREYGVVSTAGSIVTSIVEKPTNPTSNTANTGAYAFPGSARDLLDVPESQRGERELTDVLTRLIDAEDVTAVPFDGWADLAYPWDLLEATERALADVERSVDGTVHEDAAVRGEVIVEAGATVDSGVVLEGPLLVQSGASIGPNTVVRGPGVVGTDATVGHSVEVEHSLLMPEATVGHISYVGDSVVGPGANLGAGTVTANRRHDQRSVAAGPERQPTDRDAFGAVVGPDVKTGINTSLQPGAVLPADAWTEPGAVVEVE